MDTSILITLIICASICYIVYQYLKYLNTNRTTDLQEKTIIYKQYHNNLQHITKDLVNDINRKFPESTLKYEFDDYNDTIYGEIKY